jgi:phosphatidylserine decarboxylase
MKFSVLIQYCLPHHLISRIAGFLMNTRIPFLKNAIIAWFMKRYRITLNEAIISTPSAFKNFNDFFTRQLKPGARPLSSGVISPVDGTISQLGTINQNKLVQAKNIDYTLEALLAGDKKACADFSAGAFATLYLSPSDYHCVHMPLAGQLKKMIYVPGRLFSVNHQTTCNVPHLFARNERLICFFETAQGTMAVILVGAMIVASINTVWAGRIAPRKPRQITAWEYTKTSPQTTLAKGDMLGSFSLGSTVILLFEKNTVEFLAQSLGQSIKMGQALAAP